MPERPAVFTVRSCGLGNVQDPVNPVQIKAVPQVADVHGLRSLADPLAGIQITVRTDQHTPLPRNAGTT